MTFDACAITIARVLSVNAASIAATVTRPSGPGSTAVLATPQPAIAASGRFTELCSSAVVTTCCPGASSPFNATFSDSVAPRVNTTRVGSGAFRSFATVRRAAATCSAAVRAKRCVPRSGLAPVSRRNLSIRSYTDSGLGKVVAALSR